jgi:glycosyltransferase involved in cell wall biosynthesis
MLGVRLRFILPDGHVGISGGNIYNAQLILALRRGGVTVETRSIADFLRGSPSVGPDLCFVDTLNLSEFLANPEARARGTYGLVVHHLPSLEPGLSATHESLDVEARALPLFDRYLSTSEFTTALLLARGIAPQAVLTVPPGLPARSAVRARPALPPLRALLVANLIPRKAVLELLRALIDCGLDDAAFELEIVGRADLDPSYARACSELVAATPALQGRVHFRGVVPYAGMGELYETRHVLVSAARMETYGMALAEAHAHGLPILASEGGNVRQHFRDGHDGLLFDSIPALARGLLNLARTPAALPALLARADSAASAASYTWDAAAQRFMQQLLAPTLPPAP